MSERAYRLSHRVAVVILLMVHAGLLGYSIRIHSVTIDESAHIPSGLIHWKTQRFAAYRVNPPLARMVSTLPLLATDCISVDGSELSYGDPFQRMEWSCNREFRAFNRDRYQQYVILARFAGIGWSCLGGWVVWRWSRELFGDRGAVLSLAIWCFEPNLLGHAQIATPDLPGAVSGMLAVYAFWKYLREPCWPLAGLAGVAMGTALLTKFTNGILVPVCVLMLIAVRLPAEIGFRKRVGLLTIHTIVYAAISVLIVNACYLGTGTGKPLGDLPFVSQTLAGTETNSSRGLHGAGNRFRGTILSRLPIPVPEDWIRGIDVQRRDFEMMPKLRPSYLAGKWQPRGWWYYYLYALAVKVPVGTIALSLAGLVLALVRRPVWRDALAVYLPALAILALVSSQTGFNHHMRYVLGAFPFFIVGLGKVGEWISRSRPVASAVILGLAGWAVVSSLAVYPHSLSYFNEPSGGPKHGSEHLVDSNIDWGQDLIFFRKWLAAHPEARPMRYSLFHFHLVEETGLPMQPPPAGPPFESNETCGPQPGWYAVSVNSLRGLSLSGTPPDALKYFLHFEPVERIGYTILIYKIEPDECNRVRRELGLPELATDGGK